MGTPSIGIPFWPPAFPPSPLELPHSNVHEIQGPIIITNHHNLKGSLNFRRDFVQNYEFQVS